MFPPSPSARMLTAFVTIEQVMSESTLSRSSVYRAVRRGELAAPVKISPRRVAWRAADVQAWVNSRTAATSEEVSE